MSRDIDELLRSRGIQFYQRHIKEFLKNPKEFNEFPDRASQKPKWTRKKVGKQIGLSLAGALVAFLIHLNSNEEINTVKVSSAPLSSPSVAPTVVELPAPPTPAPTQKPNPTRAPRVKGAFLPQPSPSVKAIPFREVAKIPSQPLVALPVRGSVKLIGVVDGPIPPIKVSWTGDASFRAAQDKEFSKVIESSESLGRNWVFSNLRQGTLHWRGGSDSGDITVDSLANYRQNSRVTKRALIVSAAFGDVDLEMNPWTQQLRFIWENGPDASSYRIELSKNPSFTDLVFSSATAQKSATIERMWDASLVIYWRISYLDEAQNVFLIDPIRKINLNVKGSSPKADLLEPAAISALSVPQSVSIKAIGPAKTAWGCVAMEPDKIPRKWETLRQEGAYYLGRVNATATTKWIVCEARDDHESVFFSIPTGEK
jgi:hypothetical protein